tara:strand:- start:2368 stop:2595 length:228 start_codon:yes stop_codon:yes gene_type:complete
MGQMINCKVCDCEYEFKGGAYALCSNECAEEHKSRRNRVYQVCVRENSKKNKVNPKELAEGREIYDLWLKTGRFD